MRESRIKLALRKMSSETIEVDDSSCCIVSHDTQYEDITFIIRVIRRLNIDKNMIENISIFSLLVFIRGRVCCALRCITVPDLLSSDYHELGNG